MPDTPALVGTGVFVILAMLTLYLTDGRYLKRWKRPPYLSFGILVGVLIIYLVEYRLGTSAPLFADPLNFSIGLVVAGLACVCWWTEKDLLAGVLVLSLVGWIAVSDLYAIPYSSVPAMLHWVQAANQALFLGKNPYTAAGLNYFPALWLPYAVVEMLRLDPRVLNIALLLLLGGGLFVTTHRHLKAQSRDLYLLAIAGCLVLLCNPGVIHEAVEDQVLPDWIYVGIFAVGLLSASSACSALGLGLSVAARQTSLILIPLAWIEFRARFTGGIRWFLLTLLLGGLFVLPFVFWDARAFVDWTFIFNQRFPLDRWAADRAQANAISVAPPFFLADVEYTLQPIQVVLMGSLYAFSYFGRTRSASVVIRRFALVYLVFLLLNPVIWNYYYCQFFLLVLFFIFARFQELAADSPGQV